MMLIIYNTRQERLQSLITPLHAFKSSGDDAASTIALQTTWHQSQTTSNLIIIETVASTHDVLHLLIS